MAAPGGVEVDKDVVEGGDGGVEVGFVELYDGAVGGELVGGRGDEGEGPNPSPNPDQEGQQGLHPVAVRRHGLRLFPRPLGVDRDRKVVGFGNSPFFFFVPLLNVIHFLAPGGFVSFIYLKYPFFVLKNNNNKSSYQGTKI